MGKTILLIIGFSVAGVFMLFGIIMLLVCSAALNAPHAYVSMAGLVFGAVALFVGGFGAWALWQYARSDNGV